MNEGGIVHISVRKKGIYSDDPERAEGSFLDSPVAIGVLPGFKDGLFGKLKNGLSSSFVAFGGFDHFLVFGMSCRATLYSQSSPWSVYKYGASFLIFLMSARATRRGTFFRSVL